MRANENRFISHFRILITFSVPFISNFYFLRSSVNGGVDFGVWGFCSTSTDVCSKKS